MKMIIDNKEVDSLSGETFEVTAPATGQVIDTVPKANEADVKLAIDAAVRAQKSWSKVPIHQRVAILGAFLNLVESQK